LRAMNVERVRRERDTFARRDDSGPTDGQRGSREQLHIATAGHADREQQRIANASDRGVESRAQAYLPDRAGPIRGTTGQRWFAHDQDRAVRVDFVTLLATEEAIGQRQRVDEMRRRNGQAPRGEGKDGTLIDVHFVAASALGSRWEAAGRRGRFIRHHTRHLRRVRLHAPQAILYRVVQEDAKLVHGLLADVHGVRHDQHAKIDRRARIEPGALYDDGW